MKNQDNCNTVAVVIVRTCLHILEDVKSHCEASYSIDEKSDFSKGFKSGLFEFPAEKKKTKRKPSTFTKTYSCPAQSPPQVLARHLKQTKRI